MSLIQSISANLMFSFQHILEQAAGAAEEENYKLDCDDEGGGWVLGER